MASCFSLASTSSSASKMADFNTLNSIPEFNAAWGKVASQVNAEGGSALDLQSAQDTLVTTYSNLTTGQLAVDSSAALQYATDFTMTAKTVMGAVDTFSGLVAAAKGASSPAQIAAAANMFTGTLVAIIGAAGAVSAGVGSLIVAGVSCLLEIAELAGLFGSDAPGYSVCGNTLSSPPSILVGCVYSITAKRNSNGAAAWRSFPQPGWASGGWYQPATQTSGGFFSNYVCGPVTWYGDNWSSTYISSPSRMIDVALPDYHSLEAEVPADSDSSPLADFKRAFFTAWKSNKEYAFNGLQVQPDWQVLVHTVRVWNKAHDSSSYYDLGFGDGTLPYESSLMGIVQNNVSNNDQTNNIVNGLLRINTGPVRTFQRTITLKLHLSSSSSPVDVSAPALSSSSTTAKVAKGTAWTIAGISVASLVYGWAIGKGAGFVFDKVWEHGKKIFDKPVHVGESFGELREALNPAALLEDATSNPLLVGESRGTAVQTLLFSRKMFTVTTAKRWASQHGYTSRKVHVTANKIRLRQHPPGQFRRERTEQFEPGVQGVIGWRK